MGAGLQARTSAPDARSTPAQWSTSTARTSSSSVVPGVLLRWGRTSAPGATGGNSERADVDCTDLYLGRFRRPAGGCPVGGTNRPNRNAPEPAAATSATAGRVR